MRADDTRTDQEVREEEKVRSVEDIQDLAEKVKGLICGAPKADKKIDEVLELLAEALYEKVDFILEYSIEYRRRRGWFNRMLDKWAVRRLRKNAEKQAKAEEKKKTDYNKLLNDLTDKLKEERLLPQPEQMAGSQGVLGGSQPSPALGSTSVEVIPNEQVKSLTDVKKEETPQEDK